jgi:glycosyltransferase involved in cell wall biosynthesis
LRAIEPDPPIQYKIVLVYFVNHSSALDHLGGAERSMIKLVEDWQSVDPQFEPYFLTKAPHGQFVAALNERGWPFSSFRFRGWALPKPGPRRNEERYFARGDYAAVLGMLRVMRQRRPDLVVTNTVVAPWGAFAAKILGIPHAWFVREYGDLDHGLLFVNGRERTFADIGLLSEAVFANSQAIKRHISQYLPESKVSVTYPQVDGADVRERASQRPSVPPFPPVGAGLKLTVVARLASSKGQWRVVEAVGALDKRGIPASACFVGAAIETGHDAALMRRARELGVADRILIAGEQANPFPFIAAADVCITPSSNEAFGRTTLECLALGKPVVATRTGGSMELIDDGENGFLFDPDDAMDLARHLQYYAENPDQLPVHGEAAQAKVDWVHSAEHSNFAAIDRLQRVVVEEEVYRLPAYAETWMSFPELFSAESGSGVTAKYVRGRLKSMVVNFSRHPIATVRRRLRR